MRKIFLFMMTSLDGYFEGINHDISWHNTDKEFVDFAIEQLHEIDTILFGRTTYEMMAEFWLSDTAKQEDPMTAELMTNIQKIVFSTTLKHVSWTNTKLINQHSVEEIAKLKERSGKNIAIFGSNKLLVSLTEVGLVDEFRIMINPVVIGQGTPLFHGIKNKQNLKLIKTRNFTNSNILLTYEKQ